MGSNYVHFKGPQFRLLSDKQIEELHLASLKILERTGVTFECQEALDILDEAGADIANPKRVKIPSYLVEKALQNVSKVVTYYTREGEPAMTLDGISGCHFGALTDQIRILDPYTHGIRRVYPDDVADMARLIDTLPNIKWGYTVFGYDTIPGSIAAKVSFLQFIRNCTKPVIAEMTDAASLREMIEICALIAGNEKKLREKPFFGTSIEPVSPLTNGKDAMEKGLLCAEKGLPNIVYGMPMAGATAPATFAGCLAMCNAEILSQIVVILLRYPGAPLVYGAIPSIMDMKSSVFSFGAPEMSLMVAALTELCHYYKLPMFGTAGIIDSKKVDAQGAAEGTYQVLMSALSGADLVHDVGVTGNGTILSPEFMVFIDEIINMVNVSMQGIDINNETLALDLIDRVGPGGAYIAENHTLKHFRNFWSPKIFDRTAGDADTRDCDQLLNERTLQLLETHQPKPLSKELLKELKQRESSWLKDVGLDAYPKRPLIGNKTLK